jgi:hypothetical protein
VLDSARVAFAFNEKTGGTDMGLREEYYSPEELAGEIETTPDTLRNWRTARKGPPHVKVGRRVLYSRESVKAWLRQQERAPVPA